jgi:hypothetical protein
MGDLATLRHGRNAFEQRAWAEPHRLLQAADRRRGQCALGNKIELLSERCERRAFDQGTFFAAAMIAPTFSGAKNSAGEIVPA